MVVLTPDSMEAIAVKWFYNQFPKTSISLFERCVRRAATVEEVRNTVRLCLTSDWRRISASVRKHPNENLYLDEIVELDFKTLDWSLIAQSFWDRLKPRSYNYNSIHTTMLVRSYGVFRTLTHRYLITTDDKKVIKDVMNSYGRHTIEQPMTSFLSKDKIKEFGAAIEGAKKFSSDPLYNNQDSEFAFLISIGCKRYENGAQRPYYEFENRW